jgi:hypothetical protein
LASGIPQGQLNLKKSFHKNKYIKAISGLKGTPTKNSDNTELATVNNTICDFNYDKVEVI